MKSERDIQGDVFVQITVNLLFRKWRCSHRQISWQFVLVLTCFNQLSIISRYAYTQTQSTYSFTFAIISGIFIVTYSNHTFFFLLEKVKPCIKKNNYWSKCLMKFQQYAYKAMGIFLGTVKNKDLKSQWQMTP